MLDSSEQTGVVLNTKRQTALSKYLHICRNGLLVVLGRTARMHDETRIAKVKSMDCEGG